MANVNIGKVKSNVIDQVQVGDIGKPKEISKDVGVKLKNARADSKLNGHKVAIRKGPGKAAKNLGKLWTGMKKVGGGVASLVGGSVLTGLGIVKTAVSLPVNAVRYAVDYCKGTVKNEKTFLQNTPWVKDLKKPMSDGILKSKPTLFKTMTDYANGIKSPLSGKPEKLKDLINTGERLVSAIKNGELNKDGSINVTVNGKTHTVAPSTYTTLAISWYMMAKAGADGDSHLVHRGALMLKDDDNKLYNFLTKAPTAYGRVSTHLAERSGSKITKTGLDQLGVGGLLWKSLGKTPQRGIEDFQGRFPGQKGCILFDKTTDKSGQKGIYIKFESAGMPNVFRMTKAHGKHGDTYDSALTKDINSIKAFGRCFKHCTSFMKTIGEKLGIIKKHVVKDTWVHRENVNKDAPKKMVFKPFKDVLGQLSITDLAPKKMLKNMEKAGSKHGLYMIESFVSQMLDDKGKLSLPPTLKLKDGVDEKKFMENLNKLNDGITQFRKNQGDDYGIDRKGSEVHVNLDDVADDYEDITDVNVKTVTVDDDDDDDYEDITDKKVEDRQVQDKAPDKYAGLDPKLKGFLGRMPGVRNQLDKFTAQDLSDINKLFTDGTELLAVNKAREIARNRFNEG